MSHIRWTFEEMGAVAREMARLKGTNPYAGETTSVLTLAKKGQLVLPADRRRELLGKQALSPGLLGIYAAEVKKGPAPSSEAPKAEAAPPPPPPRSEREILLDFLADVVVAAAIRLADEPKIRAMLQGVIPADVHAAVAPIVIHTIANGKHDPGPFQTEKPRPPVVMILGLKPHQRAMFESRFHDRLRIKFWYDESLDLLKSKVGGSEKIYAVMGACSHEAVEACNAAGANGRLIRVTGGHNELNDVLEAFVRQRPADLAAARGAS